MKTVCIFLLSVVNNWHELDHDKDILSHCSSFSSKIYFFKKKRKFRSSVGRALILDNTWWINYLNLSDQNGRELSNPRKWQLWGCCTVTSYLEPTIYDILDFSQTKTRSLYINFSSFRTDISIHIFSASAYFFPLSFWSFLSKFNLTSNPSNNACVSLSCFFFNNWISFW